MKTKRFTFFADDKIKIESICKWQFWCGSNSTIFLFNTVQNTVRNEENAGYQQALCSKRLSGKVLITNKLLKDILFLGQTRDGAVE